VLRRRRAPARASARRRVRGKKISRMTPRRRFAGRTLAHGWEEKSWDTPPWQTESRFDRKIVGPPNFSPAYEAPSNTGNSLTHAKSTFKLNRKRPDATSMMLANIVDRWNYVSNFDTNTGAIGIVNKDSGIGNIIPLVTFNLTGYSQLTTVTADSTVAVAYTWANSTAGSPLSRFFISGGDATGAATATRYLVETTTSNAATSAELDIPKILMNTINVKMNLYGARKRDTKFYIDLVRIKDDECDFNSADVNNQEFKNLIDGLTKPLVWSNINVNESNKYVPKKKLQFLKSWRYTVPAASADDINTTVGNLKEVALNLNLNKIINYQRFDEGALTGHAQVDGDDYTVTTNTVIKEQPNETSRMYLMVRAFAPERSATGATNALIDPSIDIIIKRRYTVPAVTTRY